MKIKVLFFGIVKDIISKNNLEINVEESISISKLKEVLVKDYPKLKDSPSFAVAVNEVYQKNTYLLQNGDVVALIPPVSGG